MPGTPLTKTMAALLQSLAAPVRPTREPQAQSSAQERAALAEPPVQPDSLVRAAAPALQVKAGTPPAGTRAEAAVA